MVKKKKRDAKKIIKKLTKDLTKNYWAIASVILAVLLIISLVTIAMNPTVTKNKAGNAVITFAEAQGLEAELISVETEGSLYLVTVSISGKQTPVYVTKDGKSLVQGIIPLEAKTATPSTPEPEPQNVVKSDKPIVELFVMTHCPYGTQAEKGYLPAIAELGNAIDAKIKFTHFFLHDPEYIETPNQICIREEQNDKFAAYLTCFLEDGNSNRCLTETKVDTVKLEDCKENRYEDYYATDSALSEEYGVRGSPTLVINGAQVSTGRSPAAMLTTICSAFNEAPEACNVVLDSSNPSAGFGWSVSAGNAAAAQCG